MSAAPQARPAPRPHKAEAHVSWFAHESRDAAPVRVWLVAPPAPETADRITIVMPGTMRNAEDYTRNWRAFADRSLVLVPEFTRTDWPGSRRYALGNVVAHHRGTRTLNPPRSWAFSVIEAIHERVRRRFGVEDERFDLWGHSAGAQFVHRMALLRPRAAVRSHVAAGAGWYTAPDLATPFPYGLGDPLLGFTDADLAAYTSRPLTFMRGTDDTERDGHLRTSPEAERQGPHRFARAAFMLRKGFEANPACGWRLVDVAGAGHEPSKMAAAAQSLLRAGR